MANIMTTGTLTSTIAPLANTIVTIGDRVSMMEEKIDELYKLLEELKLETASRTNVTIVKPKEKSDLEILNTIDDGTYIDLDKVNEERVWEPYDSNWWNK